MEVFVSKVVSFFSIAALSLVLVSPVHAQYTPERVRELARLAMEQVQGPGQSPQPAGPTVNLTIDDAVQRALDKNLDIAVERINPRTYDFTIAGILSAYRPTASGTFSNANNTTLPTSQLTGAAVLNTARTIWNASVSQGVMWGGGRVTVNFNNSRTDSSNAFATRNPSFSSAIQASYTQPLLRNFKIDGTRAQLESTHLSQDISELNLKSTIATTVATVRKAYWDLLASIRAVDVARQSLELASKLVADNRQRVEIGTMAPLDVVQAQSEEAARRQTLVQAESTRRTAELSLKSLIVSGTEDELWNATLNPTDRPTVSPTPIDLEAAIGHALENRIDLQQAHKQLQSNDVSLRNLNNQTLPSLDLTATYSASGLGGTQFDRTGLGGSISETIPGGYADALTNIAHLDAPSWTVQLNVTYPLGMSSAKASLARARLQLEQTQAQVKQLELQVATEVTNIALQVRSNAEQIQAAAAARELAQKQLDAEQSKFEVGLSTNFQVVQAQRDLLAAQMTELQANLNYQKSLVDYERAQTTGTARSVTAISSGGGGVSTSGTTGSSSGGGGFGGGQ
jgi:outer membrane protein